MAVICTQASPDVATGQQGRPPASCEHVHASLFSWSNLHTVVALIISGIEGDDKLFVSDFHCLNHGNPKIHHQKKLLLLL